MHQFHSTAADRRLNLNQVQLLWGRVRKSTAVVLSLMLCAPHSVGVVDEAHAGADLERWKAPSDNVLGRFLFEQVADSVRKRRSMHQLSEADFHMVSDVVQALTLASVENDVEPFLLLAMAEVESSMNPKAVGRVGELGLMQVRPSTARWMKSDCDLRNVYCNLEVGARYVKYLKNKLNVRWRVAPAKAEALLFAAYNEGPRKVWTYRVRRVASQNDVVSSNSNLSHQYFQTESAYATRVMERTERLRSQFRHALRESLGLNPVLVTAQ